MKRYLMTLFLTLGFAIGAKALDYETAREQAYYLTDKMAYELNLNEEQYSDAYEINLDYLLSLNDGTDINTIYLEYRNADLRYILYDWQWTVFLATDYFLRPVWWYNGGWYFPIFRHYTHGYFFYDRPSIYWEYRGAHGRAHFGHRSFYSNRRPRWEGGLRGRRENMIGHPGGGRYGSSNHDVGRRGDTRYRIESGRARSGMGITNRSGSIEEQGRRSGTDNRIYSRSGSISNRERSGTMESRSGSGTDYRQGRDGMSRTQSSQNSNPFNRGSVTHGSSRPTGSSLRSSSRSNMESSVGSGRNTTSSRNGGEMIQRGGSETGRGGTSSRSGRR